ncbi:FAD-dependent oxidoreductase [Pseudovibrio japonicus]|uniref:FAD-dependent oxidoreductase n=1 Tax=Pseudovibrio japonicus TaxID=366534 RepID=UPI00167762C3|nr:FAD-dependent oxidoreductase [Pseudovibrio japonicus]
MTDGSTLQAAYVNKGIRSREIAVVIGAGFYGCTLALELARYYQSVVLIESEEAIMCRASYHNQARVHMGYHYPRCLKTAQSCRRNYQQFLNEFPDTIEHSSPSYYAIAQKDSKVTAQDFEEFCQRIGAPLQRCDLRTASAIAPYGVEQVYKVVEASFNAFKLRRDMASKLRSANVKTMLSTRAVQISKTNSSYSVLVEHSNVSSSLPADVVYICAYSDINRLLMRSGMRTVPLHHQLTEMSLLDSSSKLPNMSLTIMDGPFFSLTPFPSLDLQVLSHVSYTPHFVWLDEGGENLPDSKKVLASYPKSNNRKMILDAGRYSPAIGNSVYLESLWAVKTMIPTQQHNDGRSVLFRECDEAVYAVLGSKIDNIFDMRSMLRRRYQEYIYA